MSYLVDTVLTWGIIAIIVIFQPEIRSLLEKMGQTKREYHMDHLSNDQKEHMLDEIVDSVTKLSETQTGALITFERGQSLIDYINTGTKINADINLNYLIRYFGKEHLYMMGLSLLEMIVLFAQRPFSRQLNVIFHRFMGQDTVRL